MNEPVTEALPSKREMLEMFNALKAEVGELRAENAALKAGPSDAVKAQLAAAEAELARLRLPPTANAPPIQGKAPALIPYKGWVQATEDCHIGGAFRKGPTGKGKSFEAGDVFEVDMPVLWTDDPFVPVVLEGYTEETMRPITSPNKDAPQRVDFRFRKPSAQDTDIAPIRAGQY